MDYAGVHLQSLSRFEPAKLRITVYNIQLRLFPEKGNKRLSGKTGQVHK